MNKVVSIVEILPLNHLYIRKRISNNCVPNLYNCSYVYHNDLYVSQLLCGIAWYVSLHNLAKKEMQIVQFHLNTITAPKYESSTAY